MWDQKSQDMEYAAVKIAFRSFFKSFGAEISEDDLKMQEIYNRFFFYREEEIKQQIKNDKKLIAMKKVSTRNAVSLGGLAPLKEEEEMDPAFASRKPRRSRYLEQMGQSRHTPDRMSQTNLMSQEPSSEVISQSYNLRG